MGKLNCQNRKSLGYVELTVSGIASQPTISALLWELAHEARLRLLSQFRVWKYGVSLQCTLRGPLPEGGQTFCARSLPAFQMGPPSGWGQVTWKNHLQSYFLWECSPWWVKMKGRVSVSTFLNLSAKDRACMQSIRGGQSCGALNIAARSHGHAQGQ